MRHRFLSLAVLAGIALALFAPAQPATAATTDDSCPAGYDCVDCTKEFVFDPNFCMYPPEPPPPPTMAPMGGGMTMVPGTLPGMMPDLPGEVCDVQRTFSDRAALIETGRPDKLIYTFVVTTNFCIQNGIVTKTSIDGSTRIAQPVDPRVSIGGVFISDQSQIGGPIFVQSENVVSELCPSGVSDPVNCRKFRHIIDVTINARASNPLIVTARPIFECANTTCT